MFESYNEILNVEQVMDALDIGRTKLYRLLLTGELKGVKIGKKWKIPRQALETFIMEKSSRPVNDK